MKATDLMIGDWVQSFGEPHKIIGIRTDTPYAYIKTDMSDTWYEWGMKDLADGISLTPEILEKNGFNKPQDAGDGTLICGMTIGQYKLTFQSVFGMPILTIENVVDNDNNHTCLVLKDEIYNVHELQHALRLCGIEKKLSI